MSDCNTEKQGEIKHRYGYDHGEGRGTMVRAWRFIKKKPLPVLRVQYTFGAGFASFFSPLNVGTLFR